MMDAKEQETNIGKFIAQLRKEKKMTQKELANQLHITDKAVSKWERGLSCPDISLLNPIADILGVTTSKLLNGQKNEQPSNEQISNDIKKNIDKALVYAEKSAQKKMMSLQNILTLSFSLVLLLSIIICAICDIAISGTFTWSLFPISSIIFAWFLFVPVIQYKKKGILGSLIMLSLLMIPFLYVLNKIIGGDTLIMPIGIRISFLSILYLWGVYFLFKKLKTQKIRAISLSLLLIIPFNIAINRILATILLEPMFDAWDMLSFGIILISAFTLWIVDCTKKKNT